MKKVLILFMAFAMASSLVVLAADKSERAQIRAQKAAQKAEKEAQKAAQRAEKEAVKAQKNHEKQLAKEMKNPKDVIKDAEYKEIKTKFFNADGYGDTYNCKVAQQRFCKVKDYDTGVYVLCDREVSRTQMESAKIFYKLGRCTKLN